MTTLTRRNFLAGVGATGIGLAFAPLLTACSRPTDGRVSFLNWQDYVDPAMFEQFQKQTDLVVGYETYASNDALYDRLLAADVVRTGGRARYTFDLIVPSDNLFRRLRKEESLRPLDRSIVTDELLANLAPAMRELAFDPGNEYCIPWATGTTGIGYDTTVFPEPPTWDVFLDAAHAGKMSLLNESREAFAAALTSLGESPNTTDPTTIAAAGDLLERMSANIEFNSATYLDDLTSGRLVVAQAYSTDVFQAKQTNRDLAFVIPDAGGTRWIDVLCIPEAAPNPTGANEFIEFYLDAEVSARNAEALFVDTGNAAAREHIDPALLADASVFPDDALDARLTFLDDLGAVEDVYRREFERVVG